MEKYTETEVENVLRHIPVGYDNRISRKALSGICGVTDRTVRHIIEQIVISQRALVVSSGSGYFIPDLSDINDVMLARKYIQGEQSRYNRVGQKMGAYDVLFQPVA